jgi:6-phosphogluconolactonase
MYRITLTAPVTNLAARVVFMATGSGKALTLKAVIDGAPDPDRYPSQLIRPENGELHWFVDEAAAEALQV